VLLSTIFLVILGLSTVPYGTIAVLVMIFGRKSTIKRARSQTISFSVFLPTFNEKATIERKLDDLMTQTAFGKYDGEVLVYDCSTDGTRGILDEYALRDRRIRIIEQRTRMGVARAFNEAMDEAEGDLLVKTDSDSLSRSSENLAHLLEAFSANDHVGGVTGVCVNVGREGAFRGLMTRLQIAETNLDSTVIAHSSSLVAIRRSALEKVDPDSMAEDTEEFLRVRRAGLRTIVDPSVVSVERTPSAFFDRFQQKQRRAHGIIRALCQNADMLFNPRYGRYGMIVLPVNFFLLLISPSLLLVDLLGLIYLAFTIHLLVGLVGVVALILISSCYLSRRPSWLVATVDLQLFALVGMLNLLLGKSNSTWKVYRDK